MLIRQDFQKAAELIVEADAIVVFAGAGMGVDSGLEQYRSSNGLWTQELNIQNRKVKYLDLMTHSAFEENPNMAWAFIGSQIETFSQTSPHNGFNLLLDLLQSKDYFIVTSNIDEHFQKVGYDPFRVYECHGSINYMQCMDILEREVYETPALKIDYKTFSILGPLPVCPKCGSICRPNIMLFADWFWLPIRSVYQELRYIEWQKRNKDKNILAIEIGAGTTISTIRKMSEKLVGETKTLFRVNPVDFRSTKTNHLEFGMGALEWISTISNEIQLIL